MSSPVLSSFPALPSPTRQQLDELDTLIQRMLDLPANQLDEESLEEEAGLGIQCSVLAAKISVEPQDVRRAEFNKLATNSSYAAWQKSKELSSLPLPTAVRSNAVVASDTEIVDRACHPEEVHEDHLDVPDEAQDASPGRTYSAVDADQIPLEAHGETETVAAEKSSLDVFASFTITPPGEKEVSGPHELQRRAGRFSLLAACLLPFYWTNAAFDECCSLMGPIGRFGRSIYGRSIIGFMGLALFAVALGWFLTDWMGWTWLSAFAKIIH